MEFNAEELGWVNNALNEVLGGAYAIPEWEFSTLIGGSREEVRALLSRVNDEVSRRRRAEPQTYRTSGSRHEQRNAAAGIGSSRV